MELNQEAGKPLRFFIALVPPLSVQNYANEVKQYFATHYHSRKALNSPPHITVQPPFEWPIAQINQLSQGMMEFTRKQLAFPLALQGFAAFPPRVIYIDVVHSTALMNIKQALADCMSTQFGIVNLQNRNRSFKPHLTVAFRDLKPAAFHKAWPKFKDKAVSFEFMATHLTLLQHNGQRWLIHTQYALAQKTDNQPSNISQAD